jgi:uncharacterized protein YbjQ (UPF0145 family)
MELLELVFGLSVTVTLVAVGFICGRLAERRHYRSLAAREQALAHIVVTDLRGYLPAADPARGAEIVVGEACIATDYFKSFVAGLKKIIGGELTTYISLMDRARREAILRLKEQARLKGFDAVCNLRIDTCDIGGGAKTQGAVMVEILATGTGYRAAPR